MPGSSQRHADWLSPRRSLIGCCCLLQYILNEKEVEVKTELWTKQNADYLKEQKGEDRSIRRMLIG